MSPTSVLLRAAALTIAAGVPSAWANPSNLIHDGGFERPAQPWGETKILQPGQTFHYWLVTGASGNVGVTDPSRAPD
jgi:hypothetical protein